MSDIKKENIDNVNKYEPLTERLGGERVGIILDAMILLLIQKDIIKNTDEFVDIVEAIKVGESLSKDKY